MLALDNKELVRFITDEGMNKGNTDFVDDVFAPDYQVHTLGLALPRGPAAFKGAVALWRTAFPDFHVCIEDVIAEGDKVATRFRTTGTQRGPLMGIPPTGRTFVVTGADVHRIVDGRVVESWISDDVPRILLQIGALPADPPPDAEPGFAPSPRTAT